MKFECAYKELLNIDDARIIENPENNNKHPEEQITRLAKIISYQGQRSPIVISTRSGFITKGHARFRAIKKLKWSKIAVDFQDYENEAQEYADMTADNAIASWAEFDLVATQTKMETLQLDHDLLGIKDFILPTVFEPQCHEDEVPEQAEPVSVLGDLWQLGDHRLLCGDSTSIDAVERLCGGDVLELMYTDPPYGVKLDQSWRDSRGRTNGFGPGNKNTIKNDDRADWTDAFSLFSGPVAYVWCAHIFFSTVEKNLADCNLEFKQVIIWNKSMLVIGRSDYHWKHEPCIYAIKKGSKHHWIGGRKQTTVWDAPAPNNPTSGSKEDKTDHPSQKPIALAEIAISNHDLKNIYDPFCGSGSTLIACEKLRKNCFAIELDTKYCDIIISRWEKYTGKKAKKL